MTDWLSAAYHLVVAAFVAIGTLLAGGGPPPDTYQGYAEGEYVRVVSFGREEAVEGFVRGMLKGPNPPTGFFCVNPRATVFCLRALHKAGMDIPSQAEVVGYDDLELPVPVPTVRQPAYRLGETAVAMLLDRIEGRRKEPHKVFLDPEVVLPEEVKP